MKNVQDVRALGLGQERRSGRVVIRGTALGQRQIVRRTEKTGAASSRVTGREVPAGESEWIVGQPVIEKLGTKRCRLRRVENHRTDSEGNMAQGPLATPQCSLSPNRAWLFKWLCFGSSVCVLGRRVVADRDAAEVNAPSLFYSTVTASSFWILHYCTAKI